MLDRYKYGDKGLPALRMNSGSGLERDILSASDVPGRAWAQALGSGWASEGLGLRNLRPDPELRAGPGLGLVGLKPGLSSQNGNATIVCQKSRFLVPIVCQKPQTSSM